MVNDDEVEDFGGLGGANPLVEGARAGAEDLPAPPTGVSEDDPVAAAALPEDSSGRPRRFPKTLQRRSALRRWWNRLSGVGCRVLFL
jgi:hypothetical protein